MIQGKRQKEKGKWNKDGWRARFPVLPFSFFLLPSPARRGRPGMSLVEVMTALGIIAMLTTALMSLFISALWNWDKGSSKGQGDTAVSLAVQKVIRAIADGMTASVSGGQLTVQLPLVNNQGDYDRTQNGNTVEIYLTGSTLYQQINSGTATTLSTNITAAAFSVSSNSVTVTLTAKGQTGRRVMTTQLSQGVALRNYSTP
jgi:prepilin-type N-terminal cleavage/methylation domain-containing protein